MFESAACSHLHLTSTPAVDGNALLEVQALLPVVDDHVQFPDLRIEYEWADGRREVEDLEILTPHYRGAHAAAKARSSVTSYRSGGGRVGGRSGRGGRPFDPDLAEEFLLT